MIKHLWALLVLILVVAATKGQDLPLTLHKVYTGDIVDFTVDNLNNCFTVSSTGQLKKINSDGDSAGVFNDVRRYGKLYSIDVTNPLKVLLYFKSFGTILILDRFLNVRSTIDLRKQNLLQVKAIGQSYDNNIWVFDELESKLKKVGDDGKIIDQSADFRMLFDSMPSPQFIVDQDKLVHLYDSTKGVYLFDYYGAFKNRIMFTGWTDFTVINNVMFGRDGNFLYSYQPGTLNLEKFPIPQALRGAKKLKITPQYLYALQENRLELYNYNQSPGN